MDFAHAGVATFVVSAVHSAEDYVQIGVVNFAVIVVHSAEDSVQIVVVNSAAIAVPNVEDFVQADSVQRMVEFVVQNVEILANLYFVLSEEIE